MVCCRICWRCGRDPNTIQLCAATKMNDADAVRQAIAAGVDCCGENRVQELTAKLAANAYEPNTIQLCAATKMNDADAVRQAIAAGVDCCGENRVQELTAKLAANAYEGVPVHFIGHLQTNKVRQVVGKVDLIQSVDSKRLLQAINQEAARQGLRQNILLEVNVGAEASKSGFAPEELPEILTEIGNFPNVCVRGLMAIPPISHSSGENRF